VRDHPTRPESLLGGPAYSAPGCSAGKRSSALHSVRGSVRGSVTRLPLRPSGQGPANLLRQFVADKRKALAVGRPGRNIDRALPSKQLHQRFRRAARSRHDS